MKPYLLQADGFHEFMISGTDTPIANVLLLTQNSADLPASQSLREAFMYRYSSDDVFYRSPWDTQPPTGYTKLIPLQVYKNG